MVRKKTLEEHNIELETINSDLICIEYNGTNEKSKYICNNGHEYIGSRANILKRQIGCTICSGTDKYQNKWSETELKILKENYYEKGAILLLKELPLRTQHAIQEKARKLGLKNKQGLKTTNEYIDQLSKIQPNIIVIDEYIKDDVSILHRCDNNHTWMLKPTNALRGYGCPTCAINGFQPELPAIMYYIKIQDIYYKIGITNRTIEERFVRDKALKINVLKIWSFDLGSKAQNAERVILNKFSHKRLREINILKSGGNTELFNEDILNLDF